MTHAFRVLVLSFVSGAIVIGVGASITGAQEKPFGDPKNTAFAKSLWTEMKKYRLVGPNRINVRPFEGNEPHGSIQQVLSRPLTVDGRTAKVIVKVNHVGDGISISGVYANPNKNLGAYTVMYKMAPGYDPENKDWFWAKYKPDGQLNKNPKGMLLAGRVAKGMTKGCIACHTATGGADLETLTED